MHKSYEEGLNHPADFKVKYRFYTKEEGGRQTIITYQGYRSDFWYPNENNPNSIFMIWPEFENDKGDLILDNNKSVAEKGTARMWIIDPQKRIYHRDNIKAGLKGFFMEGFKKGC